MKNIIVASLMLCAASSASAVSITNGSFELGGEIAAGGFRSVPALNTTTITGWKVGGAGVDYIGTYWQAADGVRSIDLSSSNAGSVSQTISTIAGKTYKVFFSLSGNPDGGLGQKIAVSSVSGSVPGISTYTVGPANSRANMLWQRYSYIFTAFDTTSDLTFASATRTPYGPALDNVSITAVPEPETWALLVVGMGLVGLSARRGNRKAVAA